LVGRNPNVVKDYSFTGVIQQGHMKTNIIGTSGGTIVAINVALESPDSVN
jgi:hypothetical protein